MAFEYGFYNSIGGDRKYNAIQFGQIFDGIINDGVFLSIGEKFATTVGGGMDIIVGTGKAWFNHTWNLNTTKIPITLSVSHPVLTRYDAVVLEVNDSPDVSGRVNSIKLIKGQPSSNPEKPALVNSDYIHQYPLSYIKINPGVTSLTAADVEITVGQDPCPYVTGILRTTDITELFNNWEGQFNIWFDNLKAQLSDNIVTNLQNQIDNCLKVADIATKEDYDADTEGKIVTIPLLKQGISDVSDKRRLIAIKYSTTFIVPDSAKDNKFLILVQGGGGSGGYSQVGSGSGGGGGGGGYTNIKEFVLTPGSAIPCSIGAGGNKEDDGYNGGNGGTSSFGTLLSAKGGYRSRGVASSDIPPVGGSGGSGGGGGGSSDSSLFAAGGAGGTYGGGGGGCGGLNGSLGGRGGAGGTYGGGGGGGCNGGGGVGPAGAGGTYGGAGGVGGTVGKNAPKHGFVFDRVSYLMPILSTHQTNGGAGSTDIFDGGGGGGGGGYNGVGGNPSRGGGGGGGYNGAGGSSITNYSLSSGGKSVINYGGGGGGGYNGAGGNPGFNGVGYGAGGGGTSQMSLITYNYNGGGGGGVDIGDGYSAAPGNGSNGIILIAWEEV